MRTYSSRFSHLHLNINTNPQSNLCKYTSKVQKTSNTPIVTSKTNKSKSSIHNYNNNILNYHKQIYCKIKTKYNSTYLKYCTKTINKILYLDSTHMLAVLKDILISSDESECLHKFYTVKESKERLIQIIDYITSTSVIFPNYVTLPESKFIYENIQGKQAIIDNQQEQELKELLQQNVNTNSNKHCKYYYNDDTHHRFFSQGDMYSILSQTDTSAIKLLMGLNNDNCSVINNDNDNSCEKIINTINQVETLIENKKHKIKLHKRPQQINLSLTTLLNKTKPLSSKGRNITKTRITNANTNGSHNSINLSNNNYNTTRNYNSNTKTKYTYVTHHHRHHHRKTESAQITKDILNTIKNTTLNINQTHNTNTHKKSLINKLLRSNKEIIVIRAFRDINKQNKLSSQNALKKQKCGNSYRNSKPKCNNNNNNKQRKPSLIMMKHNNTNVLLGNSNSMNLFNFPNEETACYIEGGKGCCNSNSNNNNIMNIVPLTSRESYSRKNIKVGRSYKSKTPTHGMMSISQKKTFASSSGNTAGVSTSNGQQTVVHEVAKSKEKKIQSLNKMKRYSLSPKQQTQRLMKSYSNSRQVSQGDLYGGSSNGGFSYKKISNTIMPFKCSEISEFDVYNSNSNMFIPHQTPNSERMKHYTKHKPKLNVNVNINASNNSCYKPNNSKFIINNIDILKSKKKIP